MASSNVPVVENSTPLPKTTETDPRIQDSGFISPPTLVRYQTETPSHYFLRGQAKWSSTPLPVLGNLATPLLKSFSSPSVPTTSTPHNIEIIDFQKRLDNFEDNNSPEDDTRDSGFESLINSTEEQSDGETSVAQWENRKGENFAHAAGLYSQVEGSLPDMGAIPKRRSPRQAYGNKVDGIERLTRIKTGKRNLNIDQKDGNSIVDQNNSFSLPDIDKFTSKKNSRKFPIQVSKEGRETCDVVRHLYERNIDLGLIFTFLSAENLCKVAQVSQLWNLALASSKHDERRQNFVAVMRLEQENVGVKLSLRSKLMSPRRVMQEVANINFMSPNSGKRDRELASAVIVSPSKIRHKLFVDEASKLSPGERLVHCPLCTSPSRVIIPSTPAHLTNSFQQATCSSTKCSFVFCPMCQCEVHEGRSCRVTRTGAGHSYKVTRAGAVTSKKSKARLRRL